MYNVIPQSKHYKNHTRRYTKKHCKQIKIEGKKKETEKNKRTRVNNKKIIKQTYKLHKHKYLKCKRHKNTLAYKKLTLNLMT